MGFPKRPFLSVLAASHAHGENGFFDGDVDSPHLSARAASQESRVYFSLV